MEERYTGKNSLDYIIDGFDSMCISGSPKEILQGIKGGFYTITGKDLGIEYNSNGGVKNSSKGQKQIYCPPGFKKRSSIEICDWMIGDTPEGERLILAGIMRHILVEKLLANQTEPEEDLENWGKIVDQLYDAHKIVENFMPKAVAIYNERAGNSIDISGVNSHRKPIERIIL
ncbi:hypothetical protein KY358_07115 [Candidatus Woesearchaeota archaeon]|nr:hypothetical protein [Candidatus Woesearchaeota archaeon]